MDDRTCGTRLVMREVRDAIAEILAPTTLADVCRRVDDARERLVQLDAPMYYI